MPIALKWSALLASILVAAAFAAPSNEPSTQPAPSAPPKIGDTAPDFSLSTLDDRKISLAESIKHGPAVVVVLRGWPGYQCPICTKQVADLFVRAKDFVDADTNVILIYPGPADELKAHAREFTHDKALPAGFDLVIDPDYTFTNAWLLRWDAAGETAYPSSFVIAKDATVKFAKVSKSHGGRVSAGELVEAAKAAR
jgi:peroxiredoxin